jgi:starvation-inducible outer membrane lipoprotein
MESDDKLWKVTQTYQYRPDLLAFDLYADAGLWWVFYQRNPNTLQAPPLDFSAGTRIYIPKITTLRATLGF